jgi:hypothetical protein
MNAPRKVLRASTNTVKKLYSFGEKSLQGNLVEGTIIVILIVLTAVVLKFLPLNFLCFFNNIIVKVIFLIVIAFVALYCPAIGLMLAILLVSIIQMCQRKQLSMEIDNINHSRRSFNQLENMQQPNMKLFESMTSESVDDTDIQQINNQGLVMESYDNQGINVEPQGFNDDTSCVSGCGGSGSGGNRDNQTELNAMCGNVKTWSNQESAQGLDGAVVGLQSTIGYPL